MESVKSFKDLTVWQAAFELCLEVYRMTEAYPGHERYGLTADTRKSARQITYSIAEGQRRSTTADFLRFLNYSEASCSEFETQLLLGDGLGYPDPRALREVESKRVRVDRLLRGLTRKLRNKSSD